jgi:hypothetical protein
MIEVLSVAVIEGFTITMVRAFLVGAGLCLSIEVAHANCWVVARDPNGRELFECDDSLPQLPVCGSEYDVGGRCVIRRPRHRIPDQRRVTPPPAPGEQRSTSNPTGNTPFNAGGSWPNRAKEYSQGRK